MASRNRNTIEDATGRTTTFSKRAAGLSGDGTLNVIRNGFKCPKCNHDKAFQNTRGKKCTRCTWRKYT